LRKRSSLRTKIEVRPSFSISQHSRSVFVLEQIYHFFNCGSLRFCKSDDTFKFETRSLNILHQNIIPHFIKYPLITAKSADFDLFLQICTGLSHRQHLHIKGILEILDLAFQMNPSGKRKFTYQDLISFMQDTEHLSRSVPKLVRQRDLIGVTLDP